MTANRILSAVLTLAIYVLLPEADLTKGQTVIVIGFLYCVCLVVTVWVQELIEKKKLKNIFKRARGN